MFEPLIMTLIEAFNKMDEAGMEKWCIVNCSVPVKILNELYDTFVEKDGVKPLEQLSLEDKNKYWLIAKKYHTNQEQAIKASKAAYVLALITSN